MWRLGQSSRFAVVSAALRADPCAKAVLSGSGGSRSRNALRTADVTPRPRVFAPDLIIPVVRVPARLPIYLSVFFVIVTAEWPIVPFPFHFPLAVFELPHGHPGFITTRRWRRRRELRIG